MSIWGGNGMTSETKDMLKSALGNPLDGRDYKTPMQKGVSLSYGLTYYDLQAPAKNLYPIITPLRNAVPRIKRTHPGDATHWKQVNSILGSGYDAMGWVPEGQRSGTMSYSTSNKSASYVTLGEEDYLTFEAESASEGFEDENSMVTFRLLQKAMRKEEMAILGGNASLQLGTPATPTASVSGTGNTLPSATYLTSVMYLTFEGYKNSNMTNGCATSKTITGAEGKTFVLNGGSSSPSASVSQAVTLGAALNLVATTKPGVMAYAWYVGTAGNQVLQAITTTNVLTITGPLVTGTQTLASVGTADNSANPNLAFDGLLTQVLNPANLGYVNYLAAGATLTASGKGSVNEIDNMLYTMWQQYNLGPTVLWVNAQEQKNITTKVLSNSSGPLLRYDQPASGAQGGYSLTANGQVEYYYNPFTVDGGYKLPIKIHPDIPPGTIIGWCGELPPWYQSNEVPNVAEILLRRDYYRMDWPLRTRQREYGVYMEEVLAVYATFAMGVISNITNG
jgi:hypothetical protein